MEQGRGQWLLLLLWWQSGSFDRCEDESRRRVQIAPPSPHCVLQFPLKLE